MKDLKWLRETYFAHRGLHTSSIPENSLEAFYGAVKNGYGIEFDIQITKDNKLIVVHDNNLLRLCNIDCNVQEKTYADIKDFNIGLSNCTIPLLTDVLDSLPSSTKLLIEFKTSKKNRLIVSLFLKTISKYDFTYAVQSFNPIIVNQFKKSAKDTIRGHIAKAKPSKFAFINFFISLIPIYKIIKPDFINYRFEDLPNKKIDRLKENGLTILSYTTRTEKDLEFIRNRYDNAVFENFTPRIL